VRPNNILAAVETISPREAWAGGASGSGNDATETLLVGWAGTRMPVAL
jgi:hypothetical protein